MLLFLCLVALGFAVWNWASIERLERALSEVKVQFALAGRAAAYPKEETPASPAVAAPFAIVEPVVSDPARDVMPEPRTDAPSVIFDKLPRAMVDPIGRPENTPESEGAKAVLDLERQFGARLPVWIGGVALALAGFFLVRYTIEVGLLTESVRVVLGGIFGLTLLGAGHWARRHPTLANGVRIAQALSGAGIADLYASLFVAATLHHLISPVAGFVGMAAVTAGAVTLSLRHGPPIAVLGLVGGFLTPAMTAAPEPNVPLLFGYLYCLFAGLLAVIRKQGWWNLATPVVLAAFVWVPIIANGRFDARDGFWLLLYVMAVGATVVFAADKAADNDETNAVGIGPISLLRYVALAGSVLLGGFVSSVGGFGPVDWSLFGLLSLGGIVLAARQPRVYSFVPILALALAGMMFLAWASTRPPPTEFAVTLFMFAVLYCVSGYRLMWRSPLTLIWSAIAAAAALGSYLLAYSQLRMVVANYAENYPVWGIIAVMLALAATEIIREALQRIDERNPDREGVLAIYAGAVASFLTIGLAIELQREFLYVAVAGEMLAAAWLSTRIRIDALRPLGAALLTLFLILISPEALLVVQGAVASLSLPFLAGNLTSAVTDVSVLRLALCAAVLAGASIFLRQGEDDLLVKAIEATAAVLFSVTIYQLTRLAFDARQVTALVEPDALERSAVTNVFFILCAAYFVAGGLFKRSVLMQGAIALVAIALFRIVYFDLVIYNPVWAHQTIGFAAVISSLFSCALMFAGTHVLRCAREDAVVMALEVAATTLFSVCIYELTRLLFHPGQIVALFEPTFFERGIVTNVFFVAGFAYFAAGRHFHRAVLTRGAVVLWAIALLRIVCFDLLLYNPIWTHQFVGAIPVMNYLLLPFAMPILWCALVARKMHLFGWSGVAAGLYALTFLLLFIAVTLNVRQAFWGGYLDSGGFAESEFYAYSVAWVLTGVALLVAGTIREERTIRVASLAVMLIAIGKIFIFDASVLAGLYRIFSFLGLGVVLIALSWFYSRFVFVTAQEA